KYGITLDQTTATSYLNSSTTEIYDADGTLDSYDNNIIGIGQDNGSELNQKISKSVNSGSILILANDQDFTSANQDVGRTSLGDGNFALTGHNGAGISFSSTYNGNANNRMDRIWAFDTTGAPGSVYVAIPNTVSFSGVPSVVISADTTFDSSDTIVTLTDDGTYYWAVLTPGDGAFMSFVDVGRNTPPTHSNPILTSELGTDTT
ncbi:MAG: hypothetical protein GY750_03345, partial [Lentisphaerae bacterium]|nr:hypothetical protein [Lentisphaerota bacterium]